MHARRSHLLTASLLALTAMGAGACANTDFSPGKLAVPEGSPVAVAAREAQTNPGPWPTFALVRKAAAKDAAPKAATIDQSPILARADQLKAQTGAMPSSDTAQVEAFAAQQRAAASAVTAPADSSSADIEAFAAQARARATPPPPPS